MPYKCVHCGKLYDDGSQAVLKGCDNCSRKFFFYIRKDQLEKIKITAEENIELDTNEKVQIEHDVREIAGLEDEEMPVFLDFESVRVIKPGKYLLDLGKLFESGKPKVYKMEDGKYVVDLSSVRKD
jgi:uncharacterized protein